MPTFGPQQPVARVIGIYIVGDRKCLDTALQSARQLPLEMSLLSALVVQKHAVLRRSMHGVRSIQVMGIITRTSTTVGESA